MKQQTRVVAFDDGRFSFRKGNVVVAGVVVRLPSYLEGAMRFECEIDGRDATRNVTDAVQKSRFREQLRAIMVDGIAFGGFNVIDLEEIRDSTGIPAVSVTRRKPDIHAMQEALKKHLNDWEWRMSIIRKYEPRPAQGKGWRLYLSASGLNEQEQLELIASSIVRGNYPEPLRMAHIFAGAMSRGESAGKA